MIKAPSGRIYSVIFSTWKHEEKRNFPKVIDLYEHTGWCISLDGVNPCDLLDSEICQGCIIGNVFDNPEFLKGKLVTSQKKYRTLYAEETKLIPEQVLTWLLQYICLIVYLPI